MNIDLSKITMPQAVVTAVVFVALMGLVALGKVDITSAVAIFVSLVLPSTLGLGAKSAAPSPEVKQ